MQTLGQERRPGCTRHCEYCKLWMIRYPATRLPRSTSKGDPAYAAADGGRLRRRLRLVPVAAHPPLMSAAAWPAPPVLLMTAPHLAQNCARASELSVPQDGQVLLSASSRVE